MELLYIALVVVGVAASYYLGKSRGYEEGYEDGFFVGADTKEFENRGLAEKLAYWKDIAMRTPIAEIKTPKKIGRPKKK